MYEMRDSSPIPSEYQPGLAWKLGELSLVSRERLRPVIRCSACGAKASEGSRYCGSCGAAVGGASEAPTRTSAPSALPTELESPAGTSSTSSSAVDQGRFLPGTVLAKRYRIIGLLGRGGMGEVYRADDLKLGQPVALKFLPRDVERDEGRLQRFLNEVRMALKVTHSNVTRVHDIGEEDGHHYISMEYVDGEDLASLLRRIGRLPKDKAVQVARQLCAGLAAAHDQGVLHRDLKPANVMLDGRGQVKITDFGLAGLDETIRGAEARAGTPAYMAPEQWAGDEVTVRSDLYALGLVLYELFSGESVFSDKTPAEILKIQQEGSSSVTSPSTVIADIDPAVERVILKCLEKDPARRPVSAALPGGDPLAAALAAGETPSPELVAQAGEVAGLSPRAAALCLGLVIAGLLFWVTLGNRRQLVGYLPTAKPPQYLAETARQIVEDLGYEAEPADSLYAYTTNDDYLDHLRDSNESAEHWEVLRTGQPASLLFVYRESPKPILRWSQGQLTRPDSDPPMDVPDMIRVKLDLQGRLTSFLVVPRRGEDVGEGSDTTLDWATLLEAAGLDPAELEPSEPSWAPQVFADVRSAWSGVYPDSPETMIRVEVAAFRGKPVSFQILEPWSHAEEVWSPGLFGGGAGILGPLFFISAVALAGWVGWRNVRLGRGDRSTAIRLALYLGAVRLVWLLGAHHVPNADEVSLLMAHLAWAAWRVCLFTIFYLAVEPYVRKLWPRVLTSWVRLFGGKVRDPLVGRDLLLGVVFGLAMVVVTWMRSWALPQILGVPAEEPYIGWGMLEALRGGPHLVAATAAILGNSVLNVVMPFVILLVVFRLLLRRTWIAVAALLLVLTALLWPLGASYLPFLLTLPLVLFLFVFVLFRFGVLTWATTMFVSFLQTELPATSSPSDWYFTSTVLVVVVVAGLGVYGARTALAGRALFRDELLTDSATP